MAYDKTQVTALADSLFAAGVAFSDGIQLGDDSDEILAIIPAVVGAADEFQGDVAATIMYLGSRLLELGGDLKRQTSNMPDPV